MWEPAPPNGEDSLEGSEVTPSVVTKPRTGIS